MHTDPPRDLPFTIVVPILDILPEPILVDLLTKDPERRRYTVVHNIEKVVWSMNDLYEINIYDKFTLGFKDVIIEWFTAQGIDLSVCKLKFIDYQSSHAVFNIIL